MGRVHKSHSTFAKFSGEKNYPGMGSTMNKTLNSRTYWRELIMKKSTLENVEVRSNTSEHQLHPRILLNLDSKWMQDISRLRIGTWSANVEELRIPFLSATRTASIDNDYQNSRLFNRNPLMMIPLQQHPYYGCSWIKTKNEELNHDTVKTTDSTTWRRSDCSSFRNNTSKNIEPLHL